MKKTTQILLMMLLLLCGQAFAQVTQTIDLSTGVDDITGSHLPFGLTNDDTWTVCLPNSNPNIPGSYGPTRRSGIPGLLLISGADPAVEWIGPAFADAIGFYHYKATFEANTTACSFSAVLDLAQIGADNIMDEIRVNGALYSVNFGFTSLTQPAYTNTVSIPISNSDIINGTNTIIIRVKNLLDVGQSPGNGNPTGIIIHGALKIQSSGYLDFNFRDKNGIVKTEFCIEEDVFLKETGSDLSSPSGLEISEMNGNTPVWTLPFGTLQGGLVLGNPIGSIYNLYPFQANITKLFENNAPTPVVFQPGKTYRVKLKSTGVCNLEIVKYFTYRCCASSIDASFWGKISNGQLSVSSPTIKGTHEWKVYSIANGIAGQYTLMGTYTTPDFVRDLTTEINTCYYVTHSITTPCGDACAAQIICKAECGDKECNLTVPTGLSVNHANGTTDILTWSSVPGAVSYTIEVTPNDPRCCGGDGPLSAPYVFSNVSSPYTLSVGAAEEGPIGPGETVLRCYSWRVVAKCPDGGIVYSASKCSEGDGIGSGGGNEHGEMGKRNTSSVDKPIQQKSAQVNVYPNPTKAIISFEVNTIKEEVCNITITDLAGKKIESFDNMKTSNKKLGINWDASSLSAGEYLVKIVTSDKQIIIKKFIKE